MGIYREADAPRVLGSQNDPPRFLGGAGFDAIPDSGILHEWPVKDTTTPIPDDEESADISLNNGPTFDNTTESWWNDFAVLYDGVDDYGVVDSNRTDPGDTGTLVLTVVLEAIPDDGDTHFIFCHPDDGNRVHIYTLDGELRINIKDAINLTLTNTPQTNTLYRIAVSWDAGSVIGYLNGQSEVSGSYTGSLTTTVDPWYFASFNGTRQFSNVFVDYPRLTSEKWSSEQLTDDYAAQPWV